MKKILSIILILLSLTAKAETVEIDGICYNLVPKANAAEVTSNPKMYTGDVVIPPNITHNDVVYNVMSIGASAFSNCNLTSVTIPNSVTRIGISAFQSCQYLTSVTMSNSLSNIGNNAFSGCTTLQEVHIIDLPAWFSITFENINSNPLYFAHHLYLNGEEVTDIVIPDGVSNIGNYLFSGFSELKSISFPNCVTSIGRNAFQNCSSLTAVHVADLNAWYKISFDGVVSNPLYYAHHLFLNGEEVTDIVIPEGTTTISNYVFSGFSSLATIEIPKSVTSIGDGAFYGCSGLTNVLIPDGVTSIGQYAFYECNSLTSIIIPDGVTSIGDFTFSSCSGLMSVDIPTNVTSIGLHAFSGCSGLTIIKIPSSVGLVDHCAFYGCSQLETIVLESGVDFRGDAIFAECPNITDFYCFADNLQYTVHYFFDGSYIDYATLHVPAALVDDYKKDATWSKFMKILPIEKCATPTITYKDNELTFDCETENVEFKSSVNVTGVSSGTGNQVILTPILTVSVYAQNDFYHNSDVATKEIDLFDAKCDVNGDEDVNNEDLNCLIDILLGR